jgi:hypothetical protein
MPEKQQMYSSLAANDLPPQKWNIVSTVIFCGTGKPAGAVCDQKTSKFFVTHEKNPWQETWVKMEFIKS